MATRRMGAARRLRLFASGRNVGGYSNFMADPPTSALAGNTGVGGSTSG